MNPFEMVVLIIAIVTIGKVVSAKYGIDAWGSRASRRRDRGQLPDAVNPDEAARMKSEITRLNERIQVLERLATDPSKRLSDEIDALDTRR